jgi:hypothetical protein
MDHVAPSPTTGEPQRKDGEWRNTHCTAIHRGFESASATHSSWNGALFYGRLPRQSLISTLTPTFSYGPCRSKSNHWRGKDGEWRNTRCTAIHRGFESASATRSSWNGTIFHGRLLRQSCTSTRPTSFSFGPFRAKSYHCRHPPDE